MRAMVSKVPPKLACDEEAKRLAAGRPYELRRIRMGKSWAQLVLRCMQAGLEPMRERILEETFHSVVVRPLSKIGDYVQTLLLLKSSLGLGEVENSACRI